MVKTTVPHSTGMGKSSRTLPRARSRPCSSAWSGKISSNRRRVDSCGWSSRRAQANSGSVACSRIRASRECSLCSRAQAIPRPEPLWGKIPLFSKSRTVENDHVQRLVATAWGNALLDLVVTRVHKRPCLQPNHLPHNGRLLLSLSSSATMPPLLRMAGESLMRHLFHHMQGWLMPLLLELPHTHQL